ncbi:hydrolase [Microvirga sp. KLBC 81]|uniref:hydrolase n=1 Tax=Microvirga sp. KLBC 81 TaxID=1862707 RepID=UPI000D5162D2|nr:hydrolase [Microvirga sp. KLBC 81]PVE21808.1 hydrolase [Microvirga sp. KLBC 81]
MRRNSSIYLIDAAEDFDLISTDVFDTLLLRTIRSERSRIMAAESLFASALARQGWHVSADSLVDIRLKAQWLAFRALSVGNGAGEVKLADVIRRQLNILGIPDAFVAVRMQIELQVEKDSLRANEALGNLLRAQRRTGKRVIAISDTTLPSDGVRELIHHFHGTDVVDHVYSSADYGMTKRGGDLFPAVADAEKISIGRMLHIGDDMLADVCVPQSLGVQVHYTPRPSYRRYLRSANGAVTETNRFLRRNRRTAGATRVADQDMVAFGRSVFGPIVAHFCILIWLYAAQAEATQKPVLLFCARGGIGIREAFERVLVKLGLPLNARRENIMISRLVAARAALVTQSSAAVEELDREFRGGVFADVARALGGRRYKLQKEWQERFQGRTFLTLLHSDSGAEVLADVRRQNALFTRHFDQLTNGSDRQILCDTGLYGSTQRLLASGFPDASLETIQFARSNYKGHSEEHFPKVSGLLVEENFYSPANVHTCVLRYWHLIESLFEPKIPSVRLFEEGDRGEVIANCGKIDLGTVDPSSGNQLLSGVLAYIDALPEKSGAIVLRDAEIAWQRLKQAITSPTDAALKSLEVGVRSVDFGRSNVVQVLSVLQGRNFSSRLTSVKQQLWREGAIAREFPVLKHALLPLWGSAQSVRGVVKRYCR